MSLNRSSTTVSYHQAVFSKTVSKPKVRFKQRKKEKEKKKGVGEQERKMETLQNGKNK